MKQLTAIEAIEIVLENLKAGVRAGEGLFIAAEDGGNYFRADNYPGNTVLEFAANGELYIKSKTRVINDIEVPAPDDVRPKRGQEYWVLSGLSMRGIKNSRWYNDDADQYAFKNGLWTNKDDALANAKALQREPQE